MTEALFPTPEAVLLHMLLVADALPADHCIQQPLIRRRAPGRYSWYFAAVLHCGTIPDAESGPAHIVLGDYNLDDHNLGYCTGRVDALLEQDGTDAELQATRRFLDDLYLNHGPERDQWVAAWETDGPWIPPRRIEIEAPPHAG